MKRYHDHQDLVSGIGLTYLHPDSGHGLAESLATPASPHLSLPSTERGVKKPF